jgi:hypothetical protein
MPILAVSRSFSIHWTENSASARRFRLLRARSNSAALQSF